MNKAIKLMAIFTVVIVASYGFVSIKSESLYAFLNQGNPVSSTQSNLVASAGLIVEKLGDVLEDIVSPELAYRKE